MKLIIDDKIPFLRGVAERFGTCVYLPGHQISAEDVRDADVLIVRTRTNVNRALLEGSKVQLVVTATIGYDHIDTDYLAEADIAWHNCPGCNATSVAQYVRNSLLLAAAAGHIDPRFAQGTLPANEPLTVGIVGVGHVGGAVAELLEKEGCRILRCDPPKGEAYTLADLAREADVITFHTPLTREGEHATFHLANTAFFESLSRQPFFLNSSRGECVDTEALKAALRNGKIAAAAIDTWENEPHPDPELLEAAFIATPHIAGYSADGKANGSQMALEAVARHFGLPIDFQIQPPALPEGFAYTTSFTPSQNLSSTAAEHLRLYHPFADSYALKAHPEAFEYQRGNYPLRREKK